MSHAIFHIKRITSINALDVDYLNAFWQETDELESSPATYDPIAIVNYLSDQANIMLIAFTEDQKPVGVVLATVIRKPYKDSDFMYIDELDVHANYRKQGIAKALMFELLELARSIKLDEVWVGTETDNIAANTLYQSVGGAVKESHVGYTYSLT